MPAFNEALVAILLVLSSILVIFLIIICIKILYTTEKLNIILKDVEHKLDSVNGVFNIIDNITDGISSISDLLVGKVLQLFERIFRKKAVVEEE